MAVAITPLSVSGRIEALDAIRGLAVLGMLLVNVQSFAMIEAAYINPSAYGELTGINRSVWIWTHVLGDQKFITLFSLLFGAGIVLFARRLEDKGVSPLRPFYRRMFWLLLLGLLHAYVLWHGDILVCYAICGSIAYWLQSRSVKSLLAFGAILIAIPAFNFWLFGKSMEHWPQEALDGLLLSWNPGEEVIAAETEALRGGLLDQMRWRIPAAIRMQTFLFAIWFFWRTLGLMMWGMALYKLGMLRGVWPAWSYMLLAIAGLALGLPLILAGVERNFEAGWAAAYSMFFGWQYNYAGSIPLALSYAALVGLAARSGPASVLVRWMVPIGRMALSNYILMTLICTFIFYGHGMGFFGTVERKQQLIIVLAIWVAVVLFSHLWLRYHTRGPLERLWRRFTYGISRPRPEST